jgi:hypothetical protein
MALEAQVLGRVCRVVGESEHPGTAVLLDRDERQYLVTARHLTLGEPEEHFAVQLPPWYPDPIRHLTLKRVGPSTSKADIAVFQLARPVADPKLHLPAGTDGLVWTQEAYLLGYPLNLSGRLANGQAGIPIAKRGIVAAMDLGSDPPTIILDIVANPGLSGGPVVYRHEQSGELTVAGIVAKNLAAPVNQERHAALGHAGLCIAVDIRVALSWINEDLTV